MLAPVKLALGEIPVPSTDITSEVVLQLVGVTLSLSFEFEEGGVRKRSGLLFDGVRAHAHRTEGVSTAWHVEDVFETVTEVLGSPWLEEVESLASERDHGYGELHPYMIYLDSVGCYEAIAGSWSLTLVTVA